MREREKESDTKGCPHDYKRNKLFLREGERKEKSYATSRVRISLFFYSGGNLHSTLYSTLQLQLQLLSYWVFLYEIIKVSLTNGAFSLLGRESK